MQANLEHDAKGRTKPNRHPRRKTRAHAPYDAWSVPDETRRTNKTPNADAASRAFPRGGAMNDLTNDELKQNIAILETFVTTALGIIIAMSGPDPGKEKAIKTLDVIKEASKRRLTEVSSDMPVGE